MPYRTYESASGSGTISFDLGRYVRLGYTHSQEIQVDDSYDKLRENGDATEAGASEETSDGTLVVRTINRTHIIANSIDLQLVLYEGQVFAPYILAGGVVKQYRFEKQQGENIQTTKPDPVGPVPNVGIGIGLRLNQEFTLRFAYIASPGYAQGPSDPEPRGIWDKKVTVGLTYQL